MPSQAAAVRAAAVALALVAGCSSAPSGPLVVSWQFVDSRDCATAGAVVVQARTSSSPGSAPLASSDCGDGLAPAAVTLAGVPGSGTLYLDAIDPLATLLYRATLSLDAMPPGTGETRLVTLYAVAAQ